MKIPNQSAGLRNIKSAASTANFSIKPSFAIHASRINARSFGFGGRLSGFLGIEPRAPECSECQWSCREVSCGPDCRREECGDTCTSVPC